MPKQDIHEESRAFRGNGKRVTGKKTGIRGLSELAQGTKV